MKLSLNFVSLASLIILAFSAVERAFAYVADRVERAWGVAFDVRPTIERIGLPSLISTETFRRGVSRAKADSFVARRANRTFAGLVGGDPCSSMAFAT